MKYLFSFIIAIILSFSTLPVESVAAVSHQNRAINDEYYQELRQLLLEATDAKHMAEAGCVLMWKNLNLSIPNPEQLAKKIFDEIWEDYVAECCAVYKDYFTLQDLKALNKFYSTPVGKKFAKYQGDVSVDCSNVLSKKFSYRIQQIVMNNL